MFPADKQAPMDAMTGPFGIWLTYGAFGTTSWAGFSALAESSAY
jgi:hypothetical protein